MFFKKELLLKFIIILSLIFFIFLLKTNVLNNYQKIKNENKNINNLKSTNYNQDYSKEIEEIKKIIKEIEVLKSEENINPNLLEKENINDLITTLNFLAKQIIIKKLDFEIGRNLLINLKLEGEINNLYNYLLKIKDLNYAFNNNLLTFRENELILELEFILK